MTERIKELMGSMSQQAFADSVGVTVQAVNQWMMGRTEPGPKTVKRIAEKYGVDINWLMTGRTWSDQQPESHRPPQQFLGDRDLPVFAAVEGGKGELVVSTDPIEMVPRPWYLGEVRDGYAVVVTGESMFPVYEPGDMVIVNPRLSYMRGKDHIFIDGSTDGGFRATVKRLIRATETDWIVEQFNPAKELKLPRSTWTDAKRIVGKYTG